MTMEQQNESQLITVRTVASMLATSVRSVWRHRSAGRLPRSVNVGSAIRWRMSDIQLWIEWNLPSQMECESRKAEGRHDAQGN